MRLGEMARRRCYATKDIFRAWAVTGTVFAERIIEVSLLGRLLLGVLRSPAPALSRSAGYEVGRRDVPASMVPQAGVLRLWYSASGFW